MQRHNLAQHMQEFTQMHMRYMAEFVRSMSLGETTPRPLWTPSASCVSSEDQGAAAGPPPGPCGPRGLSMWSGGSSGVSCQSSEVSQTLREMDGRLVTQDHQLRELVIGKETQVI